MSIFFIEFFGMPGSGKSTAEKIFLDIIKNKNIEIISHKDMVDHFKKKYFLTRLSNSWFKQKLSSIFYRLYILCISIRDIYKSVGFKVYFNKQGYLSRKWLIEDKLIFESYLKDINRTDSKNIIIVNSEYFIQHAVSLYVWSNIDIANLLNSIPYNKYKTKNIKSIVICTNLKDKHEVCNRLIARGIPITWKDTNMNNHEIINNYYRAIEESINIIKNELNDVVELIELDMTKRMPEIRNNLEQIANNI